MSSINPVPGIQSAVPQLSALTGPKPQDTAASAFKDVLLDSIHKVNSMQQQADRAVENLVTGGDVNPAEVLTAVQKADLAFRLMMQTRNKLVEVYQEINNIRI